MKKIISVILALAFAICTFAACGKGESVMPEKSDRLNIVTTIFPEYDWVMQLLGDYSRNADVTMLLDNGVDLHSYQPTAEDIMKISTCDMFIYVGGESDEWVEDALLEATNKDMIVINLLDVLGNSVKNEEIKEGMETEDEETGDYAEDNDEEVEYDEHVWLSLKNAAVICGFIADSLCTLDSENADTYKSNLESYKAKLSDLDQRYTDAVSAGKTKTLLFGDRFPFRYLTDDYGLDYFAAFVGCSAESEASFETISFLAGKVDELGLKYVITIDGSDGKIAQTIINNTKSKDQQLLTLNSMQSATMKDVQNSTTYLSIMESNLDMLTMALS